MEFSNQLPNFDMNIFDGEPNEGIDGRFVPMTDSEVDNLIQTEENANTKTKRLVQEIVVAALTREISTSPLEDNIRIHQRACNILYLYAY